MIETEKRVEIRREESRNDRYDRKVICRVIPGEIRVKRGESIIFEAHDVNVRLTFPEIQPFGKIRTHKRMSSSTRSKKWLVNIPKKAKPGVYEYSVFCDDTRSYAIGNSMPVMRIDP